jgi:hypothetical protein
MTTRLATFSITVLLLAGCAKYYYGKPPLGSRTDFQNDSVACARDVGVLSGNGQYARVTREPFQRCMQARGWAREKKLEPVDYGWFRGVEDDEMVDLTVGPPQPDPPATTIRPTVGRGRGAVTDFAPR